jgi:hypothetical protein
MMHATFIKTFTGKWKPKIFEFALLCRQGCHHTLHCVGEWLLNMQPLVDAVKLKFCETIHTKELGPVTLRVTARLGADYRRGSAAVQELDCPESEAPRPGRRDSLASYFDERDPETIETIPRMFQRAMLPSLRTGADRVLLQFIELLDDDTLSVRQQLYVLVTAFHVWQWIDHNHRSNKIRKPLNNAIVRRFVSSASIVVVELTKVLAQDRPLKSNCLEVIGWFVAIGKGPICHKIFSAILALVAVSFGDNAATDLCNGLLVRDKSLLAIATNKEICLESKYFQMATFLFGNRCYG